MEVSDVPTNSRARGEEMLGSGCGQLDRAGGHAANPAALNVLSCADEEIEGQRGFGRWVGVDWLKYLQGKPVPILVARKLPNVPMYSSAFKVRAAVVSGTGKLHVSGPVQDDFRKSALLVLACLRSHWDTVEALFLQHKTPADRESIRHTAFQCDVHLSPMTGGSALGGGSAGVGIALTLLWVLTGMSFRQDTAVTGVLTLGGKVLPVGGVGEKRGVAAAVGMTHLVVPKANRDEQAAAECEKKRKRISKEEEAAAGVALIDVETLWEAVRACMTAPNDMVFPVPANLPAPRGYSRVLTVVESQPVAIECSFMAPSSVEGGTLVTGLKWTGVDTLKRVCELIVGRQDLLSAVLGQQDEFAVVGPWYWITRGIPMSLVVDCPGNPDIDTTLLAPAMLLAVVAMLWGSVVQLPEGTAVSPGTVFTDKAFSHHLSKAEVLAALEEARPVMQAEGIRRWVQLPPGSEQGPALSQQSLVAAGWAPDQVVASPREDMVSFIAEAYGIQN